MRTPDGLGWWVAVGRDLSARPVVLTIVLLHTCTKCPTDLGVIGVQRVADGAGAERGAGGNVTGGGRWAGLGGENT